MEKIDMEFFAVYKRLDKRIKEMLGTEQGVSEYVERMMGDPLGRKYVSGWKSDVETLIRLREVRNKIAHDDDDFTYSTKKDLKAVKKFYKRTLKGADPISLAKKRVPKNQIAMRECEEDSETREKNRAKALAFLAFTVLSLGVAAVLVWYALYMM